MKNIDAVVIVNGIVERLDILLCKGKIILFVYLSLHTLQLRDKSRPERIIHLVEKKIQPLICEIYNLKMSSKVVWRFMPGNRVSFEGVLASDKRRNVLIVSSIFPDNGTAGT